MEGKKKKIIIGIGIGIAAVLFVVFGTLACLGIFREFDAQRYVGAMLDQTLKGEVETVVEMTSGTTEEALYEQYENGIRSFAKNSLLGGAELDSELEEKYVALCQKIFADMKYSVQEAEKTSEDEFEVPVTYQPSNVLQIFIVSATEETTRMNEKVQKGEYRGTIEEIDAQMRADYLNNCYSLLEEAYNNMEFGEEQTIVLKVVKDENGLYELESSAITEFLTKILSLDEKQD